MQLSTSIEVGDEVSIVITGAAAYGTVTVTVALGAGSPGAPYTYGTTDALGNWTTTSTAMTSDWNILSYTDRWYVNGTELTYANNVLGGPELPTFNIYLNYDSPNCPGPSDEGESRHWIWSPVEYGSTDTSFVTGASEWNYYVADTIYLTNTPNGYEDITPYYDSLPAGMLGVTAREGQDYNGSCADTLDACGNCMTPAVIWVAYITMDSEQISSLELALGTGVDIQSAVAAHEFGHALGLGHAPDPTGVCSEVQSIMYPDQTHAVECHAYTTTAYCDGEEGISSVYPSAVAPFCSYPDPYCGHGACS